MLQHLILLARDNEVVSNAVTPPARGSTEITEDDGGDKFSRRMNTSEEECQLKLDSQYLI